MNEDWKYHTARFYDEIERYGICRDGGMCKARAIVIVRKQFASDRNIPRKYWFFDPSIKSLILTLKKLD